MKILFVVPYPYGKAPSQRFRFEQYLEYLKSERYDFTFAPFLDDKTWDILYKPGYKSLKIWGVIKGFINRIGLLFSIPSFQFIFIHREATPIGPPWFEWIVAKVLSKKIIYDFDDAIWLSNTSENNKIVARIKWHNKVKKICKWAHKVSCGNTYLQDFANQYNANSFVIPTTIDTIQLHNQIKEQSSSKLVIGWTGTHSTMKYLSQLVPVLQKLEAKYNFEFCVISNQKPLLPIKSLIFKPWRKESEIFDLLSFNVGIMPLEDDIWAKGKCAFKALQYMALGIPALVSPVGMNLEVVDHDVNGYICTDNASWYDCLESLIISPDKRSDLGRNARVKIEEFYSVAANYSIFLKLFK